MTEKENNTWDSNVVPHRSTNQARTCLTSLSGREAVLSCWYGRSRRFRHINTTIQYKHCPPLHTKEYLASRRCRMPMSKIISISIKLYTPFVCHQLGDISSATLSTLHSMAFSVCWHLEFDETQPVDITGPASGYTSTPLLQSGGIRSSRLLHFDNDGRGKQGYHTL